jgi:hypothetical protein
MVLNWGLRWKTTTIAAFIWPENWISTSGRAEKPFNCASKTRPLHPRELPKNFFYKKRIFPLAQVARIA